MLGKGKAGPTYRAIRERLAQYHAERGAEERYGLIVAMQTLITDWRKKHLSDKSERGKKHRSRLDTLQKAIDQERPTAMLHAGYVNRMKAGAFKFLSQEATTEHAPAGELIRGRTDAQQADKGLDEKALRKLEKYGLSEAELLAIKVYSVGDYALINPTVEGGMSGDKRLKENLPWLGGQLPVNLRPGDEPPADAPPAAKAAWNAKKTAWDAAAAQLVAQADFNRVKLEAQEHAGLLVEALSKLPAESRQTFRGMRLTLAEFDNWKTEQTVVTWEAFLSTSKSDTVGKEFASKKRANTLGVLLICNLKNARDIAKISAHRRELEMILLPGARLRVDKVRPVFGSYDREIEVTEL
jgi:hypothetical protein